MLSVIAAIVLGVRLITGNCLNVAYEETDTSDVDEVAEHAEPSRDLRLSSPRS